MHYQHVHARLHFKGRVSTASRGNTYVTFRNFTRTQTSKTSFSPFRVQSHLKNSRNKIPRLCKKVGRGISFSECARNTYTFLILLINFYPPHTERQLLITKQIAFDSETFAKAPQLRLKLRGGMTF